MNSERWQQVERLFNAAAQRAPEEREAFLESGCAGDDILRREVAALLAARDNLGSFMEAPLGTVADDSRADEPEHLARGQQFGRYRILSLLGRGGMGVVYLGEDTTLGRKVALKILPVAFTSDRERLRRFEQEARAASSLNHPNIITIHEIGQIGDTPYLVTEYVEGETLRQRMDRTLSLDFVLDVAGQIASALAAAHQAGIIHRDIKPENVMVRSDGLVKVLDFGSAKLAERSILTSQVGREPVREGKEATKGATGTEPGLVVGTVSYMSPEQVRGLPVDRRTDIFSLGVMMYEMVAGRRPFEGVTPSDVIAEILLSEPLPVSQLTPGLAPELEQMIRRMLGKERDGRYQSASELSADLRLLQESGSSTVRAREAAEPPAPAILRVNPAVWIAAAAVLVILAATLYLFPGRGKTIDSLAVLPLVNASANPDAEYLSDGIAESITDSLSQLPGLRIMAHTTVLRFKGKAVDPRQIGHELGVDAVLTGNLIQLGETLIVKMELVKVADGSQLWGGQYHRKLADLLGVEEEIAREISGKLRLRLSGEEKKRLTRHYTEDPEAYRLYLKGRYFWNQRKPEGLKIGIGYFQQAIDKDPGFALAYAGLADSYSMRGSTIPGSAPKENFPRAKEAALKALELDATLVEAHAALALVILRYDWDWPAAEREIARAIELNPNYALTYQWYAEYLSLMGRPDDAVAAMKRAQELDPLSLIISAVVGQMQYAARHYDQAIEQCQKTLEMDPNFPHAHLFLGRAYEQEKRYEEAIATLKRAAALSSDLPQFASSLGHAYAISGNRREAMKILDRLMALSREHYVSPHEMAILYAGLGDKDQAFAWLERAYADRAWRLPSLIVDPRFDGLRPDPRYADLIRRVGLHGDFFRGTADTGRSSR